MGLVATLTETYDLSGRGDIRLGGTLVRPVSREVQGVGGRASVEPKDCGTHECERDRVCLGCF